MTDREEQSDREAKRKEKLIKQEAESLAREVERRKAYLAKEEALGKEAEAKQARWSEKHAAEETEQTTREQTRKEAFMAREKALAEAAEARKLKEKNRQSN